ncbi:flavin reductase (plasmid) [Neorhizobium sp. NCHU2750]|nr:flavin reductase [Neorhizobium sp. NCHU2750]
MTLAILEPSPVSVAEYRSAMAQLAAPVHVITTVHDGQPYGMTATAVSSVTDTPPRLLVCINRTAQSHARLISSGVLAVNTIAADDQDLAGVFAGAGGIKDMTERFSRGRWEALETGAPILSHALAAFDCRIVEIISQASHDIMICDVVALKASNSVRPLLYFDRRFVPLNV